MLGSDSGQHQNSDTDKNITKNIIKMKTILTVLLLLCLGFALPSFAADNGEPNEGALSSHNHYKNKDGQTVHSPLKSINGKAPDGASAQCRDGTYSFSKHHSGTCSGHHGVAQWLQ
jgi:hypothetical protein